MKAALAFLAATGPIAFKVVQIVKDNPEISDYLRRQIEKLRLNDKATPEAMLATLDVLRGQVDTLTESADDEQEAARAAGWSAKLEAAARAAQLLNAPGSTAKQRKTLKKQVDALREEIFAAYVHEIDEDAATSKK